MSAEESPQLQHLNKLVEEVNPAIMRQTRVVTGNSQVSRRSSHFDPYLTKSEVTVRRLKVIASSVNKGEK
jgi:hypothetical protein